MYNHHDVDRIRGIEGISQSSCKDLSTPGWLYILERPKTGGVRPVSKNFKCQAKLSDFLASSAQVLELAARQDRSPRNLVASLRSNLKKPASWTFPN